MLSALCTVGPLTGNVRIGAPIAAITGIELGASDTEKDASAHVSTLEKQFEARHGEAHAPFYHGTFEQAQREAKSRKGVLMAMFTSRWHESSGHFMQQLADATLAQMLDTDTIICWPADVHNAYAYGLAERSGVLQFPAVIWFYHIDHRLVPLIRLEGACPAATLLATTLDVLAHVAEHEASQAERAQAQSASQRLRAEQDDAYQRSLAADARKAKERADAERAEREEQEALLLQQQEQQRLREARHALLHRIRDGLPAEPADEGIKLSLQLFDGRRVIRRFGTDTPVAVLYDWAFSLVGEDLTIDSANDLVIRTMMPPVGFERSQKLLTDAGISNQMKLIVELR